MARSRGSSGLRSPFPCRERRVTWKGTETLGYLRTKLTNQLALLVGRTRRTHLPCHHALNLALVPGWPLGSLEMETSRY